MPPLNDAASNEAAIPTKSAELRSLYGIPFQPRAWKDASHPAFLCITSIERSIAMLAPELTGELLDVGCGEQPYAEYFPHITRKRACDFNSKRGNVDFECPADRIPL